MSSSGNDASMTPLTIENEVKIASLDSDRTSAQEHSANLGNISHDDNINNNAESIDNIQRDNHNQIVEKRRSANCSKQNIDYPNLSNNLNHSNNEIEVLNCDMSEEINNDTHVVNEHVTTSATKMDHNTCTNHLMHQLSKNGCLPQASIVVFNNPNIQVNFRCLSLSFDNLKPTSNSSFPLFCLFDF